MHHVFDIHYVCFISTFNLVFFQAMAEDKSDEWFAKHNKQKAAAWDEEVLHHPFLNSSYNDKML